MKKNFLKKSFFLWIPFAAVITFACLLSYVLVQQDLRQTANDPQIGVVQDIAQAMGEGATPQDIIPPGQIVDVSASLDPFIIIYDASGTVLASSATLDNETPIIPSGVFAKVRQSGMDSFTWEPATGVRIAAVIQSFSAPSSTGGFILAGRSLKQIEIREDNVLHIAEIGWILGLIVMFAIIWACVCLYEKRENK